MNSRRVENDSLELSALDGANPLGFLAALGTLVTVRGAGEANARLRWSCERTWSPAIEGVSTSAQGAFSEIVASGLRGKEISRTADARREEAQRAFDRASTAVKKKKESVKKRGLAREERKQALNAEVLPLEQERDGMREGWLKALSDAVPRRELALGKRINCTSDEYRQAAGAFCASAGYTERDSLDLLAAFGSDACLAERSSMIKPTPFCFISGSGHQEFLETVRQLLHEVTPARIEETLFVPWTYRDEGLSMRWDPIEDRRYALMDRDPTTSDNKSRTVWMANLLAYRALALFPSAPKRWGLATTGWDTRDEEATFSWPLWEFPAAPELVCSLLQIRELTQPRPDWALLRARGISAVFRTRRVKVGSAAQYKLNFSPARAIVSGVSPAPRLPAVNAIAKTDAQSSQIGVLERVSATEVTGPRAVEWPDDDG